MPGAAAIALGLVLVTGITTIAADLSEGRSGLVLQVAEISNPGPINMQAVNAMDRDVFVATFGGVFEKSPWVAERAWASRPFASPQALHAAMMGVVLAASRTETLGFLNAHPELAGPDSKARQMTTHSTAEQGSAGLDRMSEADIARFDQLNAAYRARFGFPFIIAVRGRTKDMILTEFERRLTHTDAAEMGAALAEIAAITRMRLERLLGPFG